MEAEEKTLEDFVKLSAKNAGYKLVDEKEDSFLYKLKFKFKRHGNKVIMDNSIFLFKGENKFNVILHTRNFIPIKPADILEYEKNNAETGVYTAHIFLRDGTNFGVERYVSGLPKEKKDGKPVILRPLEQAVANQSPNILAYFSPKQKSLELYAIKRSEGGIGVAYKIQTVTSGNLYFPYNQETKRAVPYYKPEIEISDVLEFKERKPHIQIKSHVWVRKIQQ